MIPADFSNCLYDLSKVPAGERVIDYFPELRSYEEIVNASDAEARIAFALSDINSPIVRIKDPVQKFKTLFETLKISVTDKSGKILFASVSEWSNQSITNVASTYLFLQNNHDFTLWWNLNQLFYSLMHEMGKVMEKNEDIDVYVNRKLKIQKQAKPIKEELQGIESNLFNDAKMKMAIARTKISKTRTYPEMYSVQNSVV